MNVVIYANSGYRVGLGHIYRCLPISSLLKKYHYRVQLFSPLDISSIEKGWEKSEFNNALSKIEKKSIIILDSYDHNLDWRKLILERPDLTFIRFDDRGIAIEGENLIISTSPGAKIEDYQCEALCGPNYSVIDSIFLKNRKNTINKQIRSILVSLGGSDINNKMKELIDNVSKLYDGKIYFTGEKIRGIDSKNIISLGTLSQKELAKYMHKVDLGIFAGGSMIHQALCIGLPIIAFPQTKYQSKHVESWNKLNSLIPLHDMEKFEDVWYYALMHSHRKKLSSNGKKNVDGIGVKRVVNKVIEVNK